MPKSMPTPEAAATKPRTSSLPDPEGGSFNPFLKPEHLGKSQTGKIQILGVRDAPPDSFSDIVVEVTLRGKKYDLGLRFSSGNYRRLHDRFGSNPRKWRGQADVCVKEFRNKNYVAIE